MLQPAEESVGKKWFDSWKNL